MTLFVSQDKDLEALPRELGVQLCSVGCISQLMVGHLQLHMWIFMVNALV